MKNLGRTTVSVTVEIDVKGDMSTVELKEAVRAGIATRCNPSREDIGICRVGRATISNVKV